MPDPRYGVLVAGDHQQHPGGGFNPPEPTTKGGPDYGRFIDAVRKLRRTMVDLNPVEAMETLVAALKKHKTNDELLAKLDKGS